MTRMWAAVAIVVVVAACDLTQETIDEVSEALADATVASGSPPTSELYNAGRPLRESDVAGSPWRKVVASKWPHAVAVMTLGSNGLVVVHVGPGHLHGVMHWRVVDGALVLVGFSPMAEVVIAADTVCLADSGAPCGIVIQRVTPP